MSWPEALELLSAELGEPVAFRVAATIPHPANLRTHSPDASRTPELRGTQEFGSGRDVSVHQVR